MELGPVRADLDQVDIDVDPTWPISTTNGRLRPISGRELKFGQVRSRVGRIRPTSSGFVRLRPDSGRHRWNLNRIGSMLTMFRPMPAASLNLSPGTEHRSGRISAQRSVFGTLLPSNLSTSVVVSCRFSPRRIAQACRGASLPIVRCGGIALLSAACLAVDDSSAADRPWVDYSPNIEYSSAVHRLCSEEWRAHRRLNASGDPSTNCRRLVGYSWVACRLTVHGMSANTDYRRLLHVN